MSTTKKIKTSKASKNSKASKASKASKTSKPSKASKASKTSKTSKSSIDLVDPNFQNINKGMTPDGIKWQKSGSSGDECLNIYLDMDQTIIADKHSLLLMDGDVKFDTKLGKLTSAIGRMFSGETAFLNYFTGTSSNKLQRVKLGMPISGDIAYITIKYGEKIRISKGAFLAGTDNLNISSITKLGMKDIFGGVLSGEGLILSELSSNEGEAGAWIFSYGNIEKHILAEDELLFVNNNLFLAADSTVSYSIKNIGNFKSIFTDGEALVMRFKGPCYVYTQSKDFKLFIKKLLPSIPAINKHIDNMGGRDNHMNPINAINPINQLGPMGQLGAAGAIGALGAMGNMATMGMNNGHNGFNGFNGFNGYNNFD